MKLIFIVVMCFSLNSLAGDIKVIMPGSDYGKYSNEELKQRIWLLETAVSQLQNKVFALELGQSRPLQADFTCMIKSMGKSFSATASTKMKATADVLKQCSNATDEIHCDEDDVKCGN